MAKPHMYTSKYTSILQQKFQLSAMRILKKNLIALE